jgi:hypothetical protein
MMTVNLHSVAGATAHAHESTAWVQIHDEGGGTAAIFLSGPDHAARAASIADAINAAIRPPVAEVGVAA